MPVTAKPELEVNSIVYHKLTGEPVFVLKTGVSPVKGFEDESILVRRFVQSKHGSDYITAYFRPEELVNVPSQSPEALIDALFQNAPQVNNDPPFPTGGLQS